METRFPQQAEDVGWFLASSLKVKSQNRTKTFPVCFLEKYRIPQYSRRPRTQLHLQVSWSLLNHWVEDKIILDKMLTLAKKTFIHVTLQVQMASRNSAHQHFLVNCTESTLSKLWYRIFQNLIIVQVSSQCMFWKDSPLWLSVTLVKNRYYHFFILNLKLWIR